MKGKTRRRITQLLADRHAAREEVERLRPVAEKGLPIVQYMEQNNIPLEDADVILGITAHLSKGDWAGFLRAVQPYVTLAQQYTGAVLPPDLEAEVRAGRLGKERAQEIARYRAGEQVSQSHAQNAEHQRTQEVAKETGEKVRAAIVDWENATRGNDPDFAVKLNAIRQTSLGIIQTEGAPTSPEAAVDIATRAYEQVNKLVGGMRPKPKPTEKTPGSVQKTQPVARPEPTSFLDVVEGALQQ